MSVELGDRPYFSPSQLDMIARCPEQYRRRYMEFEKIPPGVAALQGIGFHGAAKVNFRQKMDSRQDLKVEEFREIAAAEFDSAASKGGYALLPEEKLRGEAVVLGEAKDETVSMAEFHAKHQAPDYQPVLVEDRIRVSLPVLSHDLLGIMDLADDKDRVTDFKTSSRRKSQDEADGSIALTAYAAFFKTRMGRLPKELRLDAVIKNKRLVRDVVTTFREAADFQALANRLNAAAALVKAGIFPPATPGAWWCNAKWCGYHSTCPFVNGGKKQQGD